jgi:Bacterial aa3 type cytochrome c oxidase subunit IV
MSIDAEYERHRRTWVGFTRFLAWSGGVVVAILAVMAFFLT